MRRWVTRTPLITVRPWLIFLLSFTLLIQILLSAFFKESATVEFYYKVGLNQSTFLKGQIWNLFSYSFFHHPHVWSHFTLNALSLFYLGGRITHILGTTTCVKILSFGILLGGLFHLTLDPLVRSFPAPLIGISGGVCALFAALCTIAPDGRFFPFMVSGKNVLKAGVISTLIFLLISPKLKVPFLSSIGQLFIDLNFSSLFNIGHACHLGGLLAGITYAAWITRIPRLKSISQKSL